MREGYIFRLFVFALNSAGGHCLCLVRTNFTCTIEGPALFNLHYRGPNAEKCELLLCAVSRIHQKTDFSMCGRHFGHREYFKIGFDVKNKKWNLTTFMMITMPPYIQDTRNRHTYTCTLNTTTANTHPTGNLGKERTLTNRGNNNNNERARKITGKEVVRVAVLDKHAATNPEHTNSHTYTTRGPKSARNRRVTTLSPDRCQEQAYVRVQKNRTVWPAQQVRAIIYGRLKSFVFCSCLRVVQTEEPGGVLYDPGMIALEAEIHLDLDCTQYSRRAFGTYLL